MLKIKTCALNEKGTFRAAVRNVIKEGLGVSLVLGNGSSVELERMPDGTYFGQIAVDADNHPIYGKVSVAVTTNEYTEKAKAVKAPKEAEVIEFE